MKYLLSENLKHPRGITLIEMLVTLSIFSMVSIVVTYSLMSSLSSRNQVRESQKLNDELRLILDTMEIEITSGSDFQTSDCSSGTCKSIAFTVATRPDMLPYRVKYSFDDITGKISKTVQRNDGVCQTLPLDPSCTFPVTSDEVVVTFVNFDVVVSGTVAQRPIVTVSIEAESMTETGETIPLAYSTSYGPRTIQNVSNIEDTTDTTPPEVLFDEIVVSSASDACSGIFSDAALTVPYDNSQPWVPNQVLPPAYTDCNKVEISYYGRDYETGIAGGRYDGSVDVQGGLCLYKACSNSNLSYYGLPFGFSSGSTEVYFTYNTIPLRLGIGVNGFVQRIKLRAKDVGGNINAPESYIDIYQMSSPDPLNTNGMVAGARLFCTAEEDPLIMLMVAPSSHTNVYQKYIHWYRCSPSGELDSCDPISDENGEQRLVLQEYYTTRYRYKTVPPSAIDYTSGTYNYVFYNRLTTTTTSPSPVSRETLYTYGFTVYDPFDETRESPIKLIEWYQNFNAALLPNPNTFSIGGALNDSDFRLADGRSFASTPYIGSIPNDYCRTGSLPPTGGGGSGPTVPDPDDPEPDPDDPEPEPVYTIGPSVPGIWTATVSLVPGGYVYTNNSLQITMSGTAPTVTVYYSSITPPFAGITLSPINTSLTQTSPTKEIRLLVPTDLSVGIYEVTLRVEGTNAPAEYVPVSLFVSQSSGGST